MPPIEKILPEEGMDGLHWNTDNEIHLFQAMAGNKPAGINRWFNMVSIALKFSNMVNKEITTHALWRHLETLYDTKMVNDIEGIPFPIDTNYFSLPDSEFGALMRLKSREVSLAASEEVEESPASPKPQTTPRSSSRGAGSKDSAQKASKKDQQTDKLSKQSAASCSNPSPVEAAPVPVTKEKEAAKVDPRRDSKDSNASSKESGSVKGSGGSSRNSTSKETKGGKSSARLSIGSSEKVSADESKSSDDASTNKRGTKRPTRALLKEEQQPTPPSRRRRI